jgi:hypothetical protein
VAPLASTSVKMVPSSQAPGPPNPVVSKLIVVPADKKREEANVCADHEPRCDHCSVTKSARVAAIAVVEVSIVALLWKLNRAVVAALYTVCCSKDEARARRVACSPGCFWVSARGRVWLSYSFSCSLPFRAGMWQSGRGGTRDASLKEHCQAHSLTSGSHALI